jgi:GNAT superfamily N-acetyltransferase
MKGLPDVTLAIGCGKLVGHVQLLSQDYLDAEYPCVELTDLYVSPKARGRGWGKYLVQMALLYAGSKNCAVYLWAFPYARHPSLDEADLIAVYHSMGFRQLRGHDKGEMIWWPRSKAKQNARCVR